jgi:hypothetical protein
VSVNEQLVRELMRHKERLRVAVYAIAGHPDTPERIRVIATSALKDVGEALPRQAGLTTGCWDSEDDAA